MFLNLLYKSLKADIVLRRVKAFVKRLLQVSAEQNASFACGALFLVSEVMKAKPGLKMLLQEEAVRRSHTSASASHQNVLSLVSCFVQNNLVFMSQKNNRFSYLRSWNQEILSFLLETACRDKLDPDRLDQ